MNEDGDAERTSPLARVILSTHARSDYATTVAKAMVVKKAPTVAEAMVGKTTDELESRAPARP